MRDRRRKLLRMNLFENTKTTDIVKELKQLISKKEAIVKHFSSKQLEDMLKSSNKIVAQEIVSCIINCPGDGIISVLE
jgi:hypothetical protein